LGRLGPKQSPRYMVFSKVGPNQSIEWGQIRVSKSAAQLQPKQAIYRCDLGIVLLRQKKDLEGKEQLQNCLAMHPSPEVERSAQLLLADPRHAREIFAPEFAFTSSKASRFHSRSCPAKSWCWTSGQRGARRAVSRCRR